MLSEVSTCSLPGSSGTLGRPPVAMRMWRAVNGSQVSGSIVRTCTWCGPSTVAQPLTMRTPALVSSFS